MYFLQVAKDDNFKYELLEHCKGCVTSSTGENRFETFMHSLDMLRYIDSEMKRREKLVKERLGRISEDINIHIYNKKFDDKLPVIQLWVDEAASLYKKTGNKEIDKIIKEAQYIIERIASTGRYIGIYLINVLQRASKEEMSREIKINTLNWISFKQVDAGASKVAIGDETSTLGLPQRVFAYKAGTEYVSFAKTPFTRWDENVSTLRIQGKIREDKQEVYDEAYSHWLNMSFKRQTESIKKAKESKRSKIVDDTLKIADSKINEANEKISTLEYELKTKEEALKNLLSENKKLNDKVNNIYSIEDNNDCIDIKEAVSSISDTEYVNAGQQKTEVHEKSSTVDIGNVPYKHIDAASISLLKSKRKVDS